MAEDEKTLAQIGWEAFTEGDTYITPYHKLGPHWTAKWEAAATAVRDKVMEWKLIKTAPKDGTPVLLCDARTGRMRWAVWAQLPAHANDPNADWLGWRDGTIEARGQIVGVIPTHYMHLPSPPCVPDRRE